MRLIPESSSARPLERSARLRAAFDEHARLVWRALRRFGLEASAVDDATQKAFLTLNAHLDEIAPGQERSFLIGVCSRVAANARRQDKRLRERESLEDTERVDEQGLTPEELLEHKERRKTLDRALDALTLDHRAVFVLFELEGFTLPEVAESLEIPLGTATSRLRRARIAFEAWTNTHQRGVGR